MRSSTIRRIVAEESVRMPAKKNRSIYQIKVTLQGIRPQIWRRIEVWEDITLAQLHRVLQIVMNWEDCHLHEFRIGGRAYSVPDPEDDLYERKVIDEKRIRLADVVSDIGTRFEYIYDFGDNWRHHLQLEAMLAPDPQTVYPRCIGGKRAAPPEDVGGTIGYAGYLKAIADPDHEDHENMLEWRGPFDPESFSLARANERLQRKFAPKTKTVVSSRRRPEIDRTPESLSLLCSLLRVPAITPAQPKRIRPDAIIPLDLSNRERDLVVKHTFAGDELTAQLRLAPRPGDRHAYHFTLADLDELAGYVAAEANHTKNKKVARELHDLHARIAELLESYMEEDS